MVYPPPGQTAVGLSTYYTYSYSYVPTATGSNIIMFAFRQDPAYWNLFSPSVVLEGSSTELLTNTAFSPTYTTPNSITAPTFWGVFYQTGTLPQAAGRVQACSLGTCWYDGAVGSFDGIYQGISMVAGQSYVISFRLAGSGARTVPTIQVGLYASPCGDPTVDPIACTIPGTKWTSLAAPSLSNTPSNTPTVSLSSSNSLAPSAPPLQTASPRGTLVPSLPPPTPPGF